MGKVTTSKPELSFLKILSNMFGEENVKHQAIVSGKWLIDFCLFDKLYIQFDGVYWHGLDRPFEEINSSKSIRDRGIINGIRKDKFQNEWFNRQNIPLLRFTDVECDKNIDIVIAKIKDTLLMID